MKKVILVRYGELFLKGKNRGYFEKLLISNIKKALSGLNYHLIITQGRYIIEDFELGDLSLILEKIKKVSGIHSFSVATEVEAEMEVLSETVKQMSSEIVGTFKIETSRADKTFAMNSMEVSRKLGEVVLNCNKNLAVNVREPKHTIFVEIRQNKKAYVFLDNLPGSGGLPNGSSNKGLLMLSGGIDSPVAGYMMAKRGMKLEGIHFHSFPYTGELAKEKVISLAKLLNDYTNGFKLHVVPFTKIQESIHKNCREDFMITLMRRFMMRIANKVAEKNSLKAIITGESLGQVASQTIESMTVTNAIANIPVLRPVVGFDKIEIIDIANKIGTYETSILPYEDCCTVFLPKNPVIKPKIEDVLEEEKHLNIDELVNFAVENIETIVI